MLFLDYLAELFTLCNEPWLSFGRKYGSETNLLSLEWFGEGIVFKASIFGYALIQLSQVFTVDACEVLINNSFC